MPGEGSNSSRGGSTRYGVPDSRACSICVSLANRAVSSSAAAARADSDMNGTDTVTSRRAVSGRLRVAVVLPHAGRSVWCLGPAAGSRTPSRSRRRGPLRLPRRRSVVFSSLLTIRRTCPMLQRLVRLWVVRGSAMRARRGFGPLIEGGGRRFRGSMRGGRCGATPTVSTKPRCSPCRGVPVRVCADGSRGSWSEGLAGCHQCGGCVAA